MTRSTRTSSSTSTIDGHQRKTLVHIGRNGHMYVMDRRTGELISAEPYDTVTSIKKIDLETGPSRP